MYFIKHKNKSDFQSFGERGFKSEEMEREVVLPSIFASPRAATYTFHREGCSYAPHLARVSPHVFSWNYSSLYKLLNVPSRNDLTLNIPEP